VNGPANPGDHVPGRPVPVLHRGYSAAVVEMLTSLTPDQKRLFRRYLELDRPRGGRPGGCWAKLDTIARRLAMNKDAIKRSRRKLQQLGFLVRSNTRPPRWFTTLPDGRELKRPDAVRAGKETDAWLTYEASKLDEHLQRRGRLRTAEEIVAGFASAARAERGEQFAPPKGDNLPPGKGTICPPRGNNLPPSNGRKSGAAVVQLAGRRGRTEPGSKAHLPLVVNG
jgi:Helix-turn-helix domain